jgi:phospholipid/cholesterol/gamma-HCH transport system substrate-binding protein
MERNVNYMIVGFFVLLGIAGIVFYASWIIGGLDRNNYNYYSVIFRDAVTGLTVKSPVLYKGIRVGEVTDIILSPDKPEIIVVNMKVKHTTPIQQYTKVSLGIQGITGQASIELDTRAGKPKPPEIQEGFAYPALEGSAAQISQVLEDVPDIAKNVLHITDKLNRLLDENTIANIEASLANMARLTQEANALLSPENVALINATLKNAESASQNVNSLTKRFEGTAKEFDKVAQELQKAINHSQKSLSTVTEDGLDQILSLVQESIKTAEQIRSLVDSLEEDPSQLLYKKQQNTIKVAP